MLKLGRSKNLITIIYTHKYGCYQCCGIILHSRIPGFNEFWFQMIPTRKRILIFLCIIVTIGILVRLLLLSRMLVEENYRRAPEAPILVAVYYEALCPDSKYFITKQLMPAYKRAKSLLEIQLVPYGKAYTSVKDDGSFAFKCQHGPVECEANRYHVCVVKIVEDPIIRLEVVACMIHDNRLPKEAMLKCARQHNVDNTIDHIQKCFDSSHAGELLKLNGDATNSLRPPVTFIPTITLDGSQGRQASVLKNLFDEICKIAGNSEIARNACNNRYV